LTLMDRHPTVQLSLNDSGAGERRTGPHNRRNTLRGGRRVADSISRPVVLVIENHDDTRELLSIVLAGAGYNGAGAGNGEAALRRLASTPLPVAIIMDLELSDYRGTALLEVLKDRPDIAAIPVLVVSGHVTAHDQQAAAAAGCAAFLGKPVLPDAVLAALARVLSMEPTE
jgi:two-component system, cell cycle response regulator DivK